MVWVLGRRMERLLLGGLVIVALVLTAWYLAFAARHYAENRASTGMESLALLIEGDEQVLQRFHDLETQRRKLLAQQQKKKDKAADVPAGENFYAKALEDKVARAAALSGSDPASLRPLVSSDAAPRDLVKSLREHRKALEDQPAAVAGMVVPNSSLATRLPAAFVANAFVIGLAPLVMLWLGALWTTRRREKQVADSEGDAYPHALNMSEVPFAELAYRLAGHRFSTASWRRGHAVALAFQRMALVALLVVPVVAGYIGAVTTLGTGADGSWLRTAYLAIVVLIMLFEGAAVVLGEAA